MGIFEVETKIRNWQNRFVSESERGEDVTCQALVDTGAVELCLPSELVDRLKLVEVGRVRVETADGGLHTYRLVGMAELEVQGRTCRVQAIEMPRGSRVLLGAIPLEEMDWHVSPRERRLLPNPRWPEDGPVQPLM
jgi:clan AA aspartic protease